MAVEFLQPTKYTDFYRQYFQESVEKPLYRQRARALEDLYLQQALRGVLGSGVGMYPLMQLEQGYFDVLGREASKLALAQAQAQQQMEEMERQRQFQREMIERQIDLQRQILEEQRRLAQQQLLGQLAGSVIGSVIMPPLGTLGTIASDWLTKQISPSYYNRIRALEDLLMQYYKQLGGI